MQTKLPCIFVCIAPAKTCVQAMQSNSPRSLAIASAWPGQPVLPAEAAAEEWASGLRLRDSCLSALRSRPVTSQSADANHTTNGETFAGSIGSKPVFGLAIVSDKDHKAQTFAEWLSRPESNYFKY